MLPSAELSGMFDFSTTRRESKTSIGQLFQFVYGVNTPWQEAVRWPSMAW
jgi:hypothetical protein